ncbi:MAG: YheU family protein [Parashewanella sp.]
MLIPYADLMTLPPATIENLIKEYLLTQVEDGSFSNMEDEHMSQAISQCKQWLKHGKLVVEYSEHDESIAIRHTEHILKSN